MNPLDAHKIYFLGIGGIGMSALARYFHLMGKEVAGYDRVGSRVTEGLQELGIGVYHDIVPERITAFDYVIYTPAIKGNHGEYAAAMSHRLPMHKRAEVLGMISQSYKTIAVAGTHGKTTTSTMLTHLLRANGIDATAFLGGISLNLQSNFVFGQSEWLVVEADEYDRSFLHLHPEWAVITSLDPDHLDIYGTAAKMQDTYKQFALQAQHRLVHEQVAAHNWEVPSKVYGETGEYQLSNLASKELKTRFVFQVDSQQIEVDLPMPGKHNVSNMCAAMGIASELGITNFNGLKQAAESFAGIYRRFEVQYHSELLTYIDDYAHHPSEIAAIISTARNLFPDRKLVVVFQPHLFSRTQDFLEAFAAELSKADAVVLMEIYPAREKPIPGVSSQALLEALTLTEKTLAAREALTSHLADHIQPQTVLFTLGAGDIDREVNRLKHWVAEQAEALAAQDPQHTDY